MGGARYERQLVNALGHESLPDEQRRVAMKAPASGSATERLLPDVLAGLRVGVAGPSPEYLSMPWAIELKVTSDTTAYADESEVDDLVDFAERFGARPLLAAKFKRPGGVRSPFYLVRPEDCRRTPAGNYGIPESEVGWRAFARVFAPTDAEPARFDPTDPERELKDTPTCWECDRILPPSWEDAEGNPPDCPFCDENPLPPVGSGGVEA